MPKPLVLSSVAALAGCAWLAASQDPASVAPRDARAPEPDSGPVVSLTSRISHPVMPAGDARDVYLHLSMRAAERPDMPRLGMNLALVIDRSGSMASEDKLHFAKSAAEQLVSRLRPDDRLAIVAYDDQVRTAVPSTPAGETGAFLAAIRELVPGGATDLFGGLVRGYEEMHGHFDAERVNGVLLLSDGLANRGVTAPDRIRGQADAWRAEGVRVSTMGMGVDYDEDLLCAIAQHAGGNYFYVNEAESVGHYLDREIDELGRVTARQPEVRIELAEGVELGEVYGHVHRTEGRTVVVPLRDFHGGQGAKVVLRLRTQGKAGERKALAACRLDYFEARTREARREQPAALTVAFSEDLEEVRRTRDPEVLVQAEIVQDAAALDDAMRMQKEGRVKDAQELLAARYLNSKTVNATEYQSADLDRILERMLQVMQDLERTRSASREVRRNLQLTTQLQALGYGGQ